MAAAAAEANGRLRIFALSMASARLALMAVKILSYCLSYHIGALNIECASAADYEPHQSFVKLVSYLYLDLGHDRQIWLHEVNISYRGSRHN